MNYQHLWEESIKQLFQEDKIDEADYENLFPRLRCSNNEGREFSVLASSRYIKDQFENKYLSLVRGKLIILTGNQALILQTKLDEQDNKNEEPSSMRRQLTLPGFDDFSVSVPTQPKKKSSKEFESKELQIRLPRTKRTNSTLNPEYNFDNYVISGNNSFACSVAQAIAQAPGKSYNPFLIYGGVGLGKTHLMHAIGHESGKNNASLRMLYITAETFVNDFLLAIRNKNQDKFKKKYRSADLLLIDDIHDLQKKRETQEELFYTYNELYENGKQLVFTCDRPARELRNLTERLKSRFEMGVQADLLPPPYEVRRAILSRFMARYNFYLEDDIAECICTHIESSVRDLEAALKQLKARSELYQTTLSIDIVQNFIQSFYSSTMFEKFSINKFQSFIAQYYNITEQELKSKKRSKRITFPRQIAMYLIRESSDFSTTEIGREFGDRDHTTVLHACQKIDEMLKTDPKFFHEMQELLRRIKKGDLIIE